MVANRSTRRGDGRDALIDAALRLIAARGLASFSMREVAAEAAMSLGSVTYHFAKRDILIEAALSQYIETFEAVTAAALQASRPQVRADAARTLTSALAWVFADRQHALVAVEMRVHATRSDKVRTIHTRLEATLKTLLGELRSRKEPRVDPAGDEAVIDALHGSVLRTAAEHSSLDRYADVVVAQLAHRLDTCR